MAAIHRQGLHGIPQGTLLPPSRRNPREWPCLDRMPVLATVGEQPRSCTPAHHTAVRSKNSAIRAVYFTRALDQPASCVCVSTISFSERIDLQVRACPLGAMLSHREREHQILEAHTPLNTPVGGTLVSDDAGPVINKLSYSVSESTSRCGHARRCAWQAKA